MLVACSLGCWWMLFCELDGRVLGGMQFGLLVDAVLRAGRVLGMRFGALAHAALRA